MKPNLIFISLALLMLFSASCSRQMASLKSTSEFQTASVLGSGKIPSEKALDISGEVIIDHAFTPVKKRPVLEPEKPIVFAQVQFLKLVKKEAGKVLTVATGKSNTPVLSPTHTTERGYPQINKAGFILIAGGVLGFFLHLILIACIIIAALGLIILLSPLFRKRY